MPCYEFQGVTPAVDPSSYVHPTAVLIGDVVIGPGCYVGPCACLRGDFGRILVEANSNIQDLTVHVSTLCDTVIGRGATIAHGAVIHGCEIGENCLVGINAVILDGTKLGPECLVAALSMVQGHMEVPARSMLAGTPAVVQRIMTADEISWRNDDDGDYQQLARESLRSVLQVEPLTSVETGRRRTNLKAYPVRLGRRTDKRRDI